MDEQLNTEELEQKLQRLLMEHGDLDAAIQAMTETGSFDQLQLQRMKKRKLVLKDQIAVLESKLLPDIIA